MSGTRPPRRSPPPRTAPWCCAATAPSAPTCFPSTAGCATRSPPARPAADAGPGASGAGRFTRDGRHYIEGGETPRLDATEFAPDSRLRLRQLPACRVGGGALGWLLRGGGRPGDGVGRAARPRRRSGARRPGRPCRGGGPAVLAVDAVEASYVVIATVGAAWSAREGGEVVVRSAPAFVGVFSGAAARAMSRCRLSTGLLVLCGSHVPLARQLGAAGGAQRAPPRSGRAARERDRPRRERPRSPPPAPGSSTAASPSSPPPARSRGRGRARSGDAIASGRDGRRGPPRPIRRRALQGRNHLGGQCARRTRREVVEIAGRCSTASRSGASTAGARGAPVCRLPRQRRRRRRHSPILSTRSRGRLLIAPFTEVLAEAGSGRAVGAFTAYDLEAAAAILAAAESRARPVVLLVSRAAFAGQRGPALVAALRDCAERVSVPACIQLDHVADHQLMQSATALGCGAVMADGSKLEFERERRPRRPRPRARRSRRGRGRGRARPPRRRRGRRPRRRRRGTHRPRAGRPIRRGRPRSTALRSRSATSTAPTPSRRGWTGSGWSRSASGSTSTSRCTALQGWPPRTSRGRSSSG